MQLDDARSGRFKFLFEAKVVSISVAAVLQALWVRMMPNPDVRPGQGRRSLSPNLVTALTWSWAVATTYGD